MILGGRVLPVGPVQRPVHPLPAGEGRVDVQRQARRGAGQGEPIIDAVRPGGLVLFNESFAATNEREGSQIARHVGGALLDAGIPVALVTHLYGLASTLYAESPRPRGQVVAGRRGSGRSSSARPDGDATAAPCPA
jgi:hypothetical protein